MPVLTLKFKDISQGTFQVEKNKTLTIGRLADNDICIENLAVSGHHAKVDAVGDGYLLTDLQSKNGTFINGNSVVSHWLAHDDIILIGKHTLSFELTEEELKNRPASSQMDQTMILDTQMYRNLMSEHPGDARNADQKKTQETVGMLSFLSGGTGEFDLSKKMIRIGKSETSDIVVSGLTVGQTAATISRRPQGYYLSYVGGMSRPKVNGEPVKESVLLKDLDVIIIGSAKMQFFSSK
ncbi:MAG: FHA domain-containing protein [Desulfatirhabdiaceae bacterium]